MANLSRKVSAELRTLPMLSAAELCFWSGVVSAALGIAQTDRVILAVRCRDILPASDGVMFIKGSNVQTDPLPLFTFPSEQPLRPPIRTSC